MAAGYAQRYGGSFQGMLHWPQLDALWAAVRRQPAGWYVVEDGQALPQQPVAPEKLLARLEAIDAVLRQGHRQSYCGIVYADDAAAPALIKVFDPNGLGSMCSCSAAPTPPRWVLSRLRPEPLDAPAAPPSGRTPWWTRLQAAVASRRPPPSPAKPIPPSNRSTPRGETE
jgi:hypothetical protein